MISMKVRKYIHKTAKEQNLSVPDNYLDILDNYCKMTKEWGYKLFFKKIPYVNPHNLSAETVFHRIYVTPAWAAQLVLHDTDDTRNAFIMTLGHERTHDDKVYRFPLLAYLYFIRHVKEVYCDFGGAKKVCNSSRDKLIESIAYKMDFQKRSNKKDNEDCTHPSWERRRYYAENFDFGEKLIRQIAKDVKCRNQWLINSVIRSYDEIILINNTKGDTN